MDITNETTNVQGIGVRILIKTATAAPTLAVHLGDDVTDVSLYPKHV